MKLNRLDRRIAHLKEDGFREKKRCPDVGAGQARLYWSSPPGPSESRLVLLLPALSAI